MRVLGRHVSREDVENEARALTKLCCGAHANLITIFRHGWLDTTCYFVDMELCDMNLHDFIHDTCDWRHLQCPEHPQFLFEYGLLTWWRAEENLRIMSQIVNGLAFIHRNHEVHRDIKPRNGKFLL